MLHWQQLEQLNNERHQMLLVEAASRRMSKIMGNKTPVATKPKRMYKWLGRRLIILACRVQASAHLYLDSVREMMSV